MKVLDPAMGSGLFLIEAADHIAHYLVGLGLGAPLTPLPQRWGRGEGAGGRGERAGFDVIIGNPPYLFGEHIPADLKPFLRAHYELAVGQYDVYWLFYERSFWLLKEQGRHGFIVPDAMLARDEVNVLRTRLLEEYRIEAIAPVGPAFDEPGVGAALVVWQKAPPDDHTLAVWHRQAGTWARVRSLPIAALAKAPGRRLWIELDPVSLARVSHLQKIGRPLREFIAVSRGEEAGRHHLRPLAKQCAGDVPILIGGDISPLSPPSPSHCIAERKIAKQRAIYGPGKIVMVKTGQDLVSTIDNTGYVTLQSVYNLNPHPNCWLRIEYLAALLSSSLLSWYLRATVTGYKQVFPQINQSNVEELPIRPIELTTPPETRATLLEEGKRLCEIGLGHGDQAGIIRFVEDQLSHEPERADVVHDLLAWLAEQVIELNRRRQALQEVVDPFEHLDRDIPFVTFSEAFAGEVVQTPEVWQTSGVFLDSVRHDTDGLRLVDAGNGWELQVQLKKRNPDDGWRSWEYESEGNRIAREWMPACRLVLSDAKARYYQVAFEVLEQFTHACSFPAGHSRIAWQKLQAMRVPAFDPEADLTPLVERRHVLAGIEDHVRRTYQLIDQIVYRLYRLVDTDIVRITSTVTGRQDQPRLQLVLL